MRGWPIKDYRSWSSLLVPWNCWVSWVEGASPRSRCWVGGGPPPAAHGCTRSWTSTATSLFFCLLHSLCLRVPYRPAGLDLHEERILFNGDPNKPEVGFISEWNGSEHWSRFKYSVLKLKKWKTYSGWCPLLGLSNDNTLIQHAMQLANRLPQHMGVQSPGIITQYLYFYTIQACMGRWLWTRNIFFKFGPYISVLLAKFFLSLSVRALDPFHSFRNLFNKHF